MLVQLAAGLFFSAVLVALSARFSPEWGKTRAILPKDEPAPQVQGHGLFLAMGAFGVTVGIPAALGLVPGNVLVVLGGMVATMTARRCLLPQTEPADAFPASPDAPASAVKRAYSPNPWLWFVPLAWSVLAAASSLGTVDLRRALGAQAALGPAALAPGPGLSILLILAFAAGLLSAVFWARESSSIAPVPGRMADALLGWGEAALAGAAATAIFFGPSIGGLVLGPASGDMQSRTAGSYLLTCFVVAFISWARKRPAPPRQRLIRSLCAGLAAAALAGAVLSL